MENKKTYIDGLDFLRGFAAIIVVIFHYGRGLMPSIADNILNFLWAYGKYGVQIFFVVSGFIIPYSLYKSKYEIKHYFINIKKRIIRICPTSYMSILLMLIVYYGVFLTTKKYIEISYWPGFNIVSVLSNITYTVDYFDTNWFNYVFWTLAIEFQFYLVIGFLFFLFINKSYYLISLALFLSWGLYYLPIYWYFTYASIFVIGTLIFLYKEKLINLPYFYGTFIMSLVICYLQRGHVEFYFSLFTAFVILYLNFSNKIFKYLGSISYSLYLVHVPIGVLIEGVGKKLIPIHHTQGGKLLMLFIYVLISIIFAHFFYKYIELYFLNKSKKIKFRTK